MKYPITCITRANKAHSVVAPRWFTANNDLRGVKSFTKSFDTLGLKDFTAASKLKSGVGFASKLKYIYDLFESDGVDYSDDDNLEAMSAYSIRHIVEHLQRNLTATNTLRRSIKDDRDLVLFKKGTSARHVIKDLILRSQRLASSHPKTLLTGLSNMLVGEKKPHRVVFSTNPWDILTMSMRGIDSCMAWPSTSHSNTGHSNCLIGSVLDPYCGVIYVTNGTKTTHGSHMFYRSVVRLVKKRGADPKSGKFHLFVEGAYLTDDDDDSNYAATEMFREVLAKRIQNNRRIESVVSAKADSYGYVVPYATATRNVQHASYFDSDVRYAEV